MNLFRQSTVPKVMVIAISFNLIFVSLYALDRSIIFRENATDLVDRPDTNSNINWTTGFVSASASEVLPEIIFDINHPDFGKPNSVKSISEARDYAHEKAYEKAESNLNHLLKNLLLNSSFTIGEKLLLNRKFREKFAGVQEWYQIKYRKTGEGIVSVTLALPFRGERGLYAILSENSVRQQIEPRDLEKEIEDQVSGLVIDVRGKDIFKPSLEPSIFTEQGKKIYGPDMVNRSCRVNRGVVNYFTNTEKGSTTKIVGARPYFLLVTGVSGKNKTDLFIADEDASIILSSPSALNALYNCAVAFIYDYNK